MNRNFLNPVAPSMSAASNSPGSIPSTPDIRSRVVFPNHIHHKIDGNQSTASCHAGHKIKVFPKNAPVFQRLGNQVPYWENMALNNTDTEAAVIMLGR